MDHFAHDHHWTQAAFGLVVGGRHVGPAEAGEQIFLFRAEQAQAKTFGSRIAQGSAARRAELAAQAEMTVGECPFGEGAELFFKVEREDGLAEIEQVDSAAEFAGALFGGAVSALGDDADDAVGLAEEGEDLGGLAVFDFAEADA